MDHWSCLFVIVSVLSATTGVPPGETHYDTAGTASFHGAHYRFSHQRSTSLSVDLDFKTVLDSGVIFIITSTDNTSDLIAVGLNSGQIQVTLTQGSSIITLESLSLNSSSSPTSHTEWHSLSFSLLSTELSLVVNDRQTLSHTLHSEIFSTSVDFGGPISFLSPPFSDLPVTEYFIGCMTNVTINDNEVEFESSLHSGVQLGCCSAPKPLSYCFEERTSNITFRTLTSNQPISVSFQIQAHRNGIVFSTVSDSTTIAAQLVDNTSLTLHLTSTSSSHDELSVECPGSVTGEGAWHSVVVTVEPSSILCDIDGARAHTAIDPVLPSSLTHSHITFGQHTNSDSISSFGGCVRRVQLNMLDIAPSMATSNELIDYNHIQWDEIEFYLSPLSVVEGESVRITHNNVHIQLPNAIFSDQFSARYEREIERAIHFRASEGPNDGYFARGVSSRSRLSDFTYYDIISLDQTEQIFYRHGGAANVTDSATLEAWVECNGEMHILFEGSLDTDVTLRNDNPFVSQHQGLHIAMGTTRVITPDIITVSDEETKDLNEITFTVNYVTAPNCGRCDGEQIGEVIRTHDPDLGVRWFSQAAVNSGNISFRHYQKYGTARVTINLRVSDDKGGSIDTTIEVFPYEGHITLVTEEAHCLFVKEGGFAMLDSSSLNASTDFQDQQPVLTYDIIKGAKLGALQKWVSYPGGVPSQWVTLEKNGTFRNGVMLPSSFTQNDINRGHIRYVHYNSSQLFLISDNFGYQVRSTNLLGPSGNFCINVIPESVLLTPDISININPVVVEEGGRVVIGDQTLVTDVDVDYLYDQDQAADIDQLAIIYILVSTPTAGNLLNNGQTLVPGSNFTEGDVRMDLLEYNHSAREEHTDSFTFYAQAIVTDDLLVRTPNRTSEVTAYVNITPVNNHFPSLSDSVVPIQPSEGGWVYVTTHNILITDADRPGDTLTIYIRKPRDNRPEEVPNGYFAFYNASGEMSETRTFTMDNVTNRKVVFIHNLEENASLSYHPRIRVDDGLNYDRTKSLSIEAIPLSMSVSLSLPDSGCVGEIDAISENLSFPLAYSHFSIMLTDHFGNDKNLVPSIKIRVLSPPSFGHLARSGSEGEPISQFTVADVKLRSIHYHLGAQRNISRDSFQLQFQYGHSLSDTISFQVCIDPLPIPNRIVNRGVSVAYKGIVGISSTYLRANTTRGSADLLEFRITRAPQFGTIFDERSDTFTPLTTFTQADLNANRVAYQHTIFSSHELEDSFEFKVCSVYGCSEIHTFPIAIHLVNLTVINTGFSVKENGTHLITLEEMNIIAPNNVKNQKFHITRRPMHGNLSGVFNDHLQSFGIGDIETETVFYAHNGRENLHDSFEFNATARSRNTTTNAFDSLYLTGFVNITIIPVNNHYPVAVNLTTDPLIVAEGGSLMISTVDVSAHDFDSDVRDVDIVYIVNDGTPIYGYFYVDRDPGSRFLGVRNWTEGMIRSGRLFYRQSTPGATTDVFFFSLFDGEKRSHDVYSILIDIKGIIFTQCGELQATIAEGGHTHISASQLCFIASNDDSVTADDFVYVITEIPENGALTFNTALLHNGDTFTTEQLTMGLLTYTHDHGNEVRDTFRFKISVPKRNTFSDTQEFPINIVPIDDDPPEVTVLQDPIFVVELGEVAIDSEVLDINDHDSRTAREHDTIECRVIKPPSFGLLPRRRFGRLYRNSLEFTKFDIDTTDNFLYNHTTLGHTRDSFIFNITDGVNHQNDTYTVNIVILPNEILLQVHSITVVENGYVSLREDDFEVLHDYLRTIDGRIVIQPGGGPQYGTFRRNTSDCSSSAGEGNIVSFTTEELAARSIIYCHGGSEHTNDSFQFIYESIGPEGYDRTSDVYTTHIEITPLNDQPPVLWPLRNILLRPWVRDTITLDTRYLNASDADTPAEGLVYTFTLHDNDGYIAYASDTLDHIRQFTQADVNAGRVVFVHQSDPGGNITYNVSDGTFTAGGNISIFARYLALECARESWESLQVSFKGSVTVDLTHLSCDTTDVDWRLITFQVESVQHGFFQVNGEESSTFTNTDVSQGLVSYVHTDVDYWELEERVDVTVSTPLANSLNVRLSIFIRYPTSSKGVLAVNRGLELKEGNETCLSENVLDARNLRYSTFLAMNGSTPLRDLVIVYRVSSLPHHGLIKYRGTVMRNTPTFTQNDVIEGVVCYQHDGSENYLDSIPFTLIIANQSVFRSPVHQSVSISITPVNDEPPRLLTTTLNATLVLGFNIVLSRVLLEVRDVDTVPASILYTFSSLPDNVELVLRGRRLSTNDILRQEDINRGELELHPLSLGTSSFQFSVSDEDTSLPYQFSLVVVEHSLELLWTRGIKYQQNQHIVLLTTDLLNTSTNGRREETRFDITRHPYDGAIAVEGVSVSHFTQVDVDEGRVSYRPLVGSQRYKDSFIVKITNRAKNITNVVVETTALVWGDVKEKTELDFGSVEDLSDVSLQLPVNVLSLDRLQVQVGSLPEVVVIDGPRYGHLQKRFILNTETFSRKRSARQTDDGRFRFQYNELKNGWIFYVLDSEELVDTSTINDSITVLVYAKGMQPGEAVINLDITPPLGLPLPSTLPPSPDTTTNTDPVASPTDTSGSSEGGFPTYVLIPIIGVFLILVLVIIVVIPFCLSQQNRIKKKLQPNVDGSAPHNHHAHYPFPLTTAPRPMFSPSYDYDPSGPPGGLMMDSDHDEHDSETSSGFSEPISPRHSPTHSPHIYTQVSIPGGPHTSSHTHLSPTYSNPPPSLPPSRPRVRSNVSITYSSRNSVTSDLSIDDSPEFYSHSLPRPRFQLSMPVPVRPASHAAFRSRPLPPNIGESGYGSVTTRTRANSSGSTYSDSNHNTTLVVAPEEDIDINPGDIPPALSQTQITDPVEPSHVMTFPEALDEDSRLPEFGDPKLFRVSNFGPVLKKQEYWV